MAFYMVLTRVMIKKVYRQSHRFLYLKFSSIRWNVKVRPPKNMLGRECEAVESQFIIKADFFSCFSRENFLVFFRGETFTSCANAFSSKTSLYGSSYMKNFLWNYFCLRFSTFSRISSMVLLNLVPLFCRRTNYSLIAIIF